VASTGGEPAGGDAAEGHPVLIDGGHGLGDHPLAVDRIRTQEGRLQPEGAAAGRAPVHTHGDQQQDRLVERHVDGGARRLADPLAGPWQREQLASGWLQRTCRKWQAVRLTAGAVIQQLRGSRMMGADQSTPSTPAPPTRQLRSLNRPLATSDEQAPGNN
jgi:hypothetical protein